MRSDYLRPGRYARLFGCMQPDNVLAMRCALETGLRIDDVLSLRPSDLRGSTITCTAHKTGKTCSKRVSAPLARDLRRNASPEWIFPGRKKGRHRTRQTVWRDLSKARAMLGLPEHVSPHSARKTYAVELRRADGLDRVQAELQHDRTSTTMIYAFADLLQNGENQVENEEKTADFEAFAEQIAEKVAEKLFERLSQKWDTK